MIFTVGCGQKENSPAPNAKEEKQEKILVYTTLFPLYDFAKTIGGEHVTVKSVLPPGAEAHDFEPSSQTIAEANKAKLFIYNGAGFETWITKVKDNLNPNVTKAVDASAEITLIKATEEHHDEHGHDEHEHKDEHASEEKHEHDHEHGLYDPHVWLDPARAKQQAETIHKALVEVDPEHKDTYDANYAKLAAELDGLDAAFKTVVANASKKEFVVSHSAFTYLAEKYGLDQIPVSGLSPSDEPTQHELTKLIKVVKEHNIKYIAFETLVESKVAKMVQKETGAEAVTIQTAENVTKEQLEQGVSYVQLMKENLEVFKKILEAKQ
jgi:zinc transport system substrate-binding protein